METLLSLGELDSVNSLMTTDQVATLLKCSKRHIIRECVNRRMMHVRIAGRYLMTADSVKTYIQEHIVWPEETKAPTLNGSNHGTVGTLSGMKPEESARNQRALRIALQLSKN